MCTKCFTRYYRKNVLKAHMLKCDKNVSWHGGRQNKLVAAAESQLRV